MSGIIFDFNLAVRNIFVNFRYTISLFLALGCTLAAALMLFTQVYSVSYERLPFERNSKLVVIYRDALGAFFDKYESEYYLRDFEGVSNSTVLSYMLTEIYAGDAKIELQGVEVDYKFFQIFQAKPIAGRVFDNTDYIDANENLAVISYDTWVKYFNKSADIVGKSVRWGINPLRIIGVMPEGFKYPKFQNIWILPYEKSEILPGGRKNYSILAKLDNEIEYKTAENQLTRKREQLSIQYPEFYEPEKINVMRHAQYVARYVKGIISFMEAVAIGIIFVGGGCVIGLSGVYYSEQSKQWLLRSVLGHSPLELIRLPAIECCFIFIAASVFGYFLYVIGIRLASEYAIVNQQNTPVWWTIDVKGIFFYFYSSYIGILLFVILIRPYMFGRLAYRKNMLIERDGIQGFKDYFVRWIYLFLQVGITTFLFIFIAITFSLYIEKVSKDRGFSIENIAVAPIGLGGNGLFSFNQIVEAVEEARLTVTSIDGIENVAFSSLVPGEERYVMEEFRQVVNGSDLASDVSDKGSINTIPVSANFFDLMGIKVTKGRAFTDLDSIESQSVGIVDESTARRLWKNESPVGKLLQIRPYDDGPIITIVGVTNGINWGASEELALFIPISQSLFSVHSLNMIVKAKDNPVQFHSGIMDKLNNIEGFEKISEWKTMSSIIARSGETYLHLAYNFTPAVLLALLMVVSSVYSRASQTAQPQKRNIGILKSLGSSNRFIIRVCAGRELSILALSCFSGAFLFILFSPKILKLDVSVFDSLFIIIACATFTTMISFVAFVVPFIKFINKNNPAELIKNI